MLIKSLHVRRFRSIVNEFLECTQLTALIGTNGSGKSSFLRALDLFYSPRPKFTADDFYNKDISHPIEIEITFTALTTEEQVNFHDYLGSDELKVLRELSLHDGRLSDKCYGYRKQNPDFSNIRSAASATEQKRLYQLLLSQEQYTQLPNWTRKEQALAALVDWELQHVDCCKPQRDSGDFFCCDAGAPGDLSQFTRFIFIPAVRDAATDATEGKGSAITELMDMLVRNALASRDDIKNLKAEFQQRYDDIFNRESLPEVTELETQLTQTLIGYIPGASVTLSLRSNNTVDIPVPKVEMQFTEDGYSSDITRKGHGFQRSFILTALQHLAVAQPPFVPPLEGSETINAEQQSTLILVIEEPELYQHPQRQRHFASILSKLAGGTIAGVAQQTQVLYCTHSPLFISIDWFDNLRLLRKAHAVPDSLPKKTIVTSSKLNKVAEILWLASDRTQQQYTADTLRPRLRGLITPAVNEGFFANVVVLVEGDDDHAAIYAVATLLHYDLQSQGICIIPCNGKSNLGKAAAIFKSLEIPTYVIWDSDHNSFTNPNSIVRARDENRCLLRLMGKLPVDWPNDVADTFACFESNLENTLKEEMGCVVFDHLIEKCQRDFDIPKRKQAIKNPMVIATLLQEAKADGHCSQTLEEIIHKIMALRISVEVIKRTFLPAIADVQIDDSSIEEYVALTQVVAARVNGRPK